MSMSIETFKKSYERMIRHETFSKYAKRTDNSKLRTDDKIEPYNGVIRMKRELMIPIETTKLDMPKDLMIPIETFQELCL